MITLALLMFGFLAFAGFVIYAWHLRTLLSTKRCCGRCNSQSISRIPRKDWERKVGTFVDSRKFRCLSCGWTGLIRVEPQLQPGSVSKSSDPASSTAIDVVVPSHLRDVPEV